MLKFVHILLLLFFSVHNFKNKNTHAPVKKSTKSFLFVVSLNCFNLNNRTVPLCFRVTHVSRNKILLITIKVSGPSTVPGPFQWI